jgi:hypothetical protein
MPARVPTFKGSVATFVSPGLTGVDQPLLTIFNKTGSGVLVAVRRLHLFNDHAGAGTTTIRDWRTSKITTAPSTGTLATPQPFDTADTHNANVEVRALASADGTNGTLTAPPTANRLNGDFNQRFVSAVGQYAHQPTDLLVEYPYPDDPLILREGEGIVVSQNVSGSTTNNIVFDVVIEEFTYSSGESHSGSWSVTGGGVVASAASKQGLRANALTGGGATTQARTAAHNATTVTTGGGVTVLARSTARSRANPLTASGVLTQSRQKNGLRANTLTGGGVVAQSSRKGATPTLTLTGGGVVAWSPQKGATRAQATTGGGTVVFALSVGHVGAYSLTGGGVVALARSGGRLGAVSLTGAGVVTLGTSAAHSTTFGLAGSGTVTSAATTARSATSVLTGGGVVVFEYDAQSGGEAEETLTLTGGGAVSFAATTGRRATQQVTGAGAVPSTHAGGHSAQLLVTGGGRVVLVATIPPPPEVLDDGAIRTDVSALDIARWFHEVSDMAPDESVALLVTQAAEALEGRDHRRSRTLTRAVRELLELQGRADPAGGEVYVQLLARLDRPTPIR